MPKIAIIGYQPEVAWELREKIDRVMQKLGLSDEAITDIATGHVTRSCDGQEQAKPYLLVCSTEIGEIDDIMVALIRAGIGEDTEQLLINDFRSAEEMRGDPEFGSEI